MTSAFDNAPHNAGFGQPQQFQAPQGQFQAPQGQQFQAPQGQFQAPQGQAPQGQAPQGQAPQGQFQAPQGQAPQGQFQAPQGQFQAPQGQFQAPQGQAPQGQFQAPQGQQQAFTPVQATGTGFGTPGGEKHSLSAHELGNLVVLRVHRVEEQPDRYANTPGAMKKVLTYDLAPATGVNAGQVIPSLRAYNAYIVNDALTVIGQGRNLLAGVVKYGQDSNKGNAPLVLAQAGQLGPGVSFENLCYATALNAGWLTAQELQEVGVDIDSLPAKAAQEKAALNSMGIGLDGNGVPRGTVVQR